MDDNLITIAEYSESLEAELAKMHLEHYGINSVVLGANIAGSYPLDSICTIEIQVFSKDAERAKKLITEFESSDPDLEETSQ